MLAALLYSNCPEQSRNTCVRSLRFYTVWATSGQQQTFLKMLTMHIKPFFRAFIGVMLAVVIVSVAAIGGYQYGTEKTKENCGRALEVAFVDQVLRETTEARHDRGIVELFDQKRLDDAVKLSQTRYFTRILILPDVAKSSFNPDFQQAIQEEISQAKALAARTAFKFDNERDQKKWGELVKTVPDPTTTRPENKTGQISPLGTPVKGQ
jgi:hypothetical protein